jgi:hypothetical protein
MNTDSIWYHFNRTFEEVDKFFEKRDRLFEEARKTHSNVHLDKPDEHTVQFRSVTVKERAKLAWGFFCMTLSMVFRGHARVVFRRRKPIK